MFQFLKFLSSSRNNWEALTRTLCLICWRIRADVLRILTKDKFLYFGNIILIVQVLLLIFFLYKNSNQNDIVGSIMKERWFIFFQVAGTQRIPIPTPSHHNWISNCSPQNLNLKLWYYNIITRTLVQMYWLAKRIEPS